ncbi:hypothetical protein Patl1_09739 [Pistacia atlantica]|uniref:Uncharacterized protein n=1 Tax=Pistacia atlantica TaxID=434234 RepID=A0ACC1A3W3_9ROSI|nr:hypothetical protein Patl1_09739 [Pistacia atlantica]
MATDAMLSVLSNEVFRALQVQAQYAIDFKDQFEVMRTKLELMGGFLSPENLRSNGSSLKMALQNMRKLIYEADDILTDCQIRDEYRNDGSSACSRKFSPRELYFLIGTGKKLKGINLRIESIERSLEAYPRRSKGLINGGYVGYQSKSPVAQNYDPSETIGLQNDIKEIKNWLFTDQGPRQVGIVGMGGLGKTTIAREIFNDRDVIEYFDEVIWVPVSNNFSKEGIMRVMLKQLGEEGSGFDEADLLGEIHKKLEAVENAQITTWKKKAEKSRVNVRASR